MRHVLTIAGSDSCAGAGIQADLKTISALGGYGLSVITAVTAQNTLGVTAVQEISAEVIQAQLEAIFSDIEVHSLKIGMLFSAETVKLVADFLRSIPEDKRPAAVLDPVMVSKSGHSLLKSDAIAAIKEYLMPLVYIVTPNLPETEMLGGNSIKTVAEMETAAKAILELGSDWVIVKGGHLPGDAQDVVAGANSLYSLQTTRIVSNNNHGTGCTFSAAIATYLAQGEKVDSAIKKAKDYVTAVLGKGFPIGSGVGVLSHFDFIDNYDWRK